MQITTDIFLSRTAVKESGFDPDMYLSVSKAKIFDSCKAKYKYQYIEKLPKKHWDFLVFGKFLHFVLENFHSALLDDPELKKTWEPLLKRSWGLAVKEYDEHLTGEQKLEAGPIVKRYKEILTENGLPNVIGVEKDFNIVVTDGNIKILLNGFIDRLEIDDDGVLHVSDYKTTKNMKYLKNDFFQLQVYAFVLMLENEKIQKIRASYIGLRHDFKFITKEYTREEIIEPIGKKIIEYVQSIMKEKMWRPNPSPLCSFCDFNDTCKAGERFLIKIGKKKPSQVVGKIGW